MRYARVVLCVLLWSATAALGQVSIGFAVPGVSIGINLPAYPQLVRVPGYPVYYAPGLDVNFFFYDGLYWVYEGDRWYASAWYNGPWELVLPEAVPGFVLRIPVRYYRDPPPYFRGWRRDAPPRWGEHWGSQWAEHRRGWDRWDRRSAPAPAPLPLYQRRYSGSRYPGADEQRTIRMRHYRYAPRDPVARERYENRNPSRAAPPPRGEPRPGFAERRAAPPQAARPERRPGRAREDRPHDRGAGQAPEGRRGNKPHGKGEERDRDREPGR